MLLDMKSNPTTLDLPLKYKAAKKRLIKPPKLHVMSFYGIWVVVGMGINDFGDTFIKNGCKSTNDTFGVFDNDNPNKDVANKFAENFKGNFVDSHLASDIPLRTFNNKVYSTNMLLRVTSAKS
jgi:hypothetical protein